MFPVDLAAGGVLHKKIILFVLNFKYLYRNNIVLEKVVLKSYCIGKNCIGFSDIFLHLYRIIKTCIEFQFQFGSSFCIQTSPATFPTIRLVIFLDFVINKYELWWRNGWQNSEKRVPLIKLLLGITTFYGAYLSNSTCTYKSTLRCISEEARYIWGMHCIKGFLRGWYCRYILACDSTYVAHTYTQSQLNN